MSTALFIKSAVIEIQSTIGSERAKSLNPGFMQDLNPFAKAFFAMTLFNSCLYTKAIAELGAFLIN
ncbi:MAG: hypothetical protein UHL07_03035 [Bacteroidaceae bacterium]|nr:hypothetical protein [Bacteroidaceae bacterium]